MNIKLTFECNTVLRSGRLFPTNVMKKALQKYQEQINQNRAIGEFDEPKYGEVINLSNVSHKIVNTQIKQNGNIDIQIQILQTPIGKKVEEKLETGLQLGIVPRGIGSTEDGVVNDDYELITWDLVPIQKLLDKNCIVGVSIRGKK